MTRPHFLTTALLAALFAAWALSHDVTRADERVRPQDLPSRAADVPVIPADLLSPDDWDNFTPVSPLQLQTLLRGFRKQTAVRDSTASRAEYSARLEGLSLVDGRVRFQFPRSAILTELTLGRTNLQQLRLFVDAAEVPLATGAGSGLIPLLDSMPEVMTGQWQATGVRRGRSVSFELSLPEAEVCVFTLTTDMETRVRSPDSLVQIVDQTGGRITWNLIPDRPGTLTVNCSAMAEAGNDVAYLNIESDVRLYENDADISWSVVAPEVLAGAAIRFDVIGTVDITAVRMAETELAYQVRDEDGRSWLEISLPALLTAAVRIEAAFPSSGAGAFDVPFLNPVSFLSDQELTGSLVPRMPTIRATVGPDDAIVGLGFQGLYEQDVTFPSDGSQVVELQQYQSTASLKIQVADTRPLVEEDLLVKVSSQSRVVTADAFLRISSRSGTISRLSWDVPANWRVTDVRESEINGPPLLFRISAEDPQQPARLDVILRQPVSANDAARFLVVRMQAVEGSLTSQPRPAGLTSRQHDRLVDLVALPPGVRASLVDAWSSGPLTAADIQESLPWVDDTLLQDTEVFPRSDLSLQELPEQRAAEVRAEVDYAVSVTGRQLRQVAKIRISSNDDLPSELLLSVPGGVVPGLEGPTGNLTLDQVASGDQDSWVLLISPEIASTRQAEFSLVVESEPDPATPGLVVLFNDCVQSGRIQPPAVSDVALLLTTDGRTERVTSAIEYPMDAFRLSLEVSRSDRSVAFVSGRGFLTVSREMSGVQADAVCRCLVQPGGQSELQFEVQCGDVAAEIDGRSVFVEQSNGICVLPVNNAAETVAVDIFLSRVAVQRSRISLPLIRFVETGAEIDWIVRSGRDDLSLATIDGTPAVVSQLGSARAGDLILPQQAMATESRRIRAFAARWRVWSTPGEQSFLVEAEQLAQADAIVLRLPVPVWMWSILTAVVAFLAWQLSGWFSSVRCGGVLLLLAVTGLAVDSFLLDGLILGTVMFVSYRAATQLLTELVRGARRRFQRAATSISLLLLIVVSPAASAQILTEPPSVFSVDRTGNSPVVYVEKRLLERLAAAADDDQSSLAVLETWVDITLDDRAAGTAEIRALVAGDRSRSGSLPLVLDGMTLVSCEVDGLAAFPRRDAAGNVTVETGVESLLPLRPLPDFSGSDAQGSDAQGSDTQGSDTQGPGAPAPDLPVSAERAADEPGPAAAGPRSIGSYLLREVTYTVRFSVERDAGQMRLLLPVLESPMTQVTLRDKTGELESARLVGAEGLQQPQASGVVTFPMLSNAARVDLLCQLQGGDAGVVASRQDASVTAVVDVLADRMTITTEYTLPAALAQQDRLRFEHAAEQVVSVRASGNPVTWTAVGDGISIAGDSQATDDWVVVVRQEIATALTLRKQLALDPLRTINGRPAQTLTLVLRTTDQFIWREVLGDGRPLPAAPIPVDPELVRPMERRVLASDKVASLSLEMTERISTQLASISQQVIVGDEEIRWRCACDSEISGQPAFRQVILLDSQVRVERVTATLAGADRLQFWTRTPDGVVVSLREATRGNLQINMEGTLPRSSTADTRLPVVEFPPDVEVLQAVLDLSSDATSGAFVASFGGARPDVPFEVDDQIPEEPVRLSIIDDREPLVIRQAVRQQLDLEIVALLYEAAGQLRVATAVAVQARDPLAPIRFRIRGADLESQRPIVVRGQQRAAATVQEDTILIAPPAVVDETMRTIVLLPNAIPVGRDGAALVETPEFDAAASVLSVRCYDLRPAGSRRRNTIPRWVQERSTDLNVATPAAGVLRLCEFDEATRRIQVQLPRQTSNAITASVSADVLYVDCEHRVDAAADGVAGASGFLVFATQSRSQFLLPAVPDLNFVRVHVNGRPAMMKRLGDQREIRLPTTVCHIVVEWVYAPPGGIGMVNYEIPVPEVAYQRGQNRISIAASAQRRGMRIQGSPLQPELFLERRSTSIVEGLQTLPTEVPAEPPSPVTRSRALPETLWSQLSVRAPAAAASLDHFLEGSDGADRTLISQSENRVAVSEFHAPPWPASAAFLTGIALLAAFRVRSRSGQTGLPVSEQATVIRDREAESTELTKPTSSVAR